MGKSTIRKYAPPQVRPRIRSRDRPRRVTRRGGNRITLDRSPFVPPPPYLSIRGRAIPFARRSQCSVRIYYLTGIIDGLWIRVPGVHIPRGSRHFRDGDAPRGRESRSSSSSTAANRRRVNSRNLPGGNNESVTGSGGQPCWRDSGTASVAACLSARLSVFQGWRSRSPPRGARAPGSSRIGTPTAWTSIFR